VIEVRDIPLPTAPEGSPGLTGALAVPDGDGPWPGVVLVFEAYGMNDVMRRQVARVAEAGYLALMPDLYAAGGPRRCLGATMRAMRRGEGRAFVDVESARAELASRADCTGEIGILGFCMGGGFALAAAAGHGFAAASANYGFLPADLGRLADACPIVGSYGARDRSLRGTAATLERVLTENGVAHDIREYPTAGHSFLNDEETGPPWMRVLTRPILRAGPDPEAAADAWRRIEAFFGEHLRGGG
jgi:carboxymethylenebutenolidase